MLYNRNQLAAAVRYSLYAGSASLACVASQAIAQDDGDDMAQMERVEVTGSRLSQVDIEGASPVTILDRTDIERTGLNDLGELIRQLPSITGSPLGTQTNNGGTGASRVDIRGLGTNRTLVLVNGRRDINTGVAGGDLGTIPLSLVERIEVLKEGASSVYGADAVAGVVNIITRKDFEGAEIIGNYGSHPALITNPAAAENFDPSLAGSSGASKRVSFVAGGNTDRGNFVIGLEYNEQDQVFQGNIDDPIGLFGGALAAIDFPALEGLNLQEGLDAGAIISFGSSRTVGGRFATSNGVFTIDDNGDIVPNSGTYNFAPVNFAQTPFERVSAFAQGDYELFDGVTAYVEARFTNRESEQLLAPLPYDTRFDPAAPLPGGGNGVPASNVFNPFGEDLTDVRRRVVETGGRSFNQEINQFQSVTGLRGGFGDWASTWEWDVNWQWGRQTRIDTDFGQFSGSQLALALGPSFFDESGNAVCGTPDAPIAGCVPLNLFGGGQTQTITQEQLDFVTVALNDRIVTERQVFNATFKGDLIDLPGGALSTAFGYEFRDESFDSIPDSGKVLGTVTGNTGLPTGGDFEVDSLFVEVNIPLLSGIPGAELLELGGGFRYDDFSSIGDTGNFSAALRWQPFQGLLIRGSFSEVFREPNVQELFLGASDAFPSVQDLCSTGIDTDGDGVSDAGSDFFSGLSAAGQAECLAQGVPAGGFLQSDSQIITTVLGNPDLGPESGETYTVGLAWSPDFIPGFSSTVDYWEVQLDDAIQTIAASAVFNQCLVAGVTAQCDAITRLPGGDIADVQRPSTNIGAEDATGIDFALNYNFNTGIGVFDTRFLGTYLIDRVSTLDNGLPDGTPGQFISADAAGNFDERLGLNEAIYPEFRGNFVVDWSLGNFGASVNVQYIGSVDEIDENATAVEDPTAVVQQLVDSVDQSIDSEFYLDIAAEYNFPWGTQLKAGLNNVFDNLPPFIDSGFNASTDTDSYRFLGRQWFVQLKHSF